jgi:hypothetical protein
MTRARRIVMPISATTSEMKVDSPAPFVPMGLNPSFPKMKT